MSRKRAKLPGWSDPRWFLLLFLATYAFFFTQVPSFTRTPSQFFVSFVTCVGLDLLFIRYYKKAWFFPLSGIISTFGVFLLTDSSLLWPYVLVGALTILSKHFLTVEGRHIFNPNNFGIVVSILLFPTAIATEGGRWGGHIAPTLFMFTFGLAVAYCARRLPLTTTYLATFALGVIARAAFYAKPVFMIGAPMTGAAFQLFVFYMISDPMTTPDETDGQILFAIVLATLDTILRMNQFKNAPFLSLFVMSGIFSYARLREFKWLGGGLRKKLSLLRPRGQFVWVLVMVAIGTAFYAGHEMKLVQQQIKVKRAEWVQEARAYALPLNNPSVVPAKDAHHMRDDDLVFGVLFHGHARAYPRWLMIVYHVCNDTFDEKWPLLISQCEVCSSAAAFIPTMLEYPYGPLAFTPCGFHGGTFKICDHYTNSRWQPFSGVAFEGPLKGRRLLERIPVAVQTWKNWKKLHPDTDVVLAAENVRFRNHNRGPDFDFGAPLIPPLLARTADLTDQRLPNNELVLGLTDPSMQSIAFPLKKLGENSALEYDFQGKRYLIVHYDKFAVVAFSLPDGVSGLKLFNGSRPLISDQSGGRWDLSGRPLDGSTNKSALTPADAYLAEWYEWVNAHPKSGIFGS